MKTKIKFLSGRFSYWLSVAILGTILSLSLQLAYAWVNPPTSGTPPGNANVGAPINTSQIGQVKDGSMMVARNPLTYIGFIVAKGNVGIGTVDPNAKLTVNGLSGTAMSTTFQTNAGALGTSAGNELALGSIGGMTSTNQSALGIRLYREANGSGWDTSGIQLSYDVDNTPRAGGAYMELSHTGNVIIKDRLQLPNGARAGEYLGSDANGVASWSWARPACHPTANYCGCNTGSPCDCTSGCLPGEVAMGGGYKGTNCGEKVIKNGFVDNWVGWRVIDMGCGGNTSYTMEVDAMCCGINLNP